MYLQPLIKTDLSRAGYLVGDTDTAVCAVVDPPLDMIDNILELASAKGMRIISVIETQLHADPPSGSRELARRTGATLYMYVRAADEYRHQKLPDGILRLFSTRGSSTTHAFEQGEQLMAPEANVD